MATLIHIPRSNTRFGGNVPVAVNGKVTKIPVGQDYLASDDEIAALTAAGIPKQVVTPREGSIWVSTARYGSRIPIGINGVVSYIATGVSFVPTAAQLAALDGKGIEYISSPGPSNPPAGNVLVLRVRGGVTQYAFSPSRNSAYAIRRSA